MAKRSRGSSITLMEAFDHLSDMTEEGNWSDSKQALQNQPLVKEIFNVIHDYLRKFCDEDPARLKDPETLKGLQSIMLLVSDATQKMDQKLAVSKLQEFKSLQKFYLEKIAKRIAKREYTEEWEQSFGTISADPRRSFKDLGSVRRDTDYELFFIRNEKGLPYFNSQLLRHIRLIGNFDHLVSSVWEEDPFLAVKKLQDRSIYEGAKEILTLAQNEIDDFYAEGMSFKDKLFVKAVSKSLMALLMAGHSDNLLENGARKSCLSYYSDFLRYLRALMQMPGYGLLISQRQKQQDFSARIILALIHALCFFFFFRIGSRKEVIVAIHSLIQRGEKIRRPEKEPYVTIPRWKKLVHADENIRLLFKRYPNGPLLKTLDALREKSSGFDPLSQENFPKSLFAFDMGEKDITLVHLPTPTRQEVIDKCKVTGEFYGLLRYFQNSLKKPRHLLFNLQDRTSWQQHITSKTLENFAKMDGFSDVLSVVTLPCDTDFYWQRSDYQDYSGAPIFIEQLLQQLEGGTDYGYFFPVEIKREELFSFAEDAASFIHEQFFKAKTTLTHIQRLDFIEIFQCLLALKCMELVDCDSFSFTCKDGLDKGAAKGATFFALLHLLTKQAKWNAKQWDTLLWLFYSPAFVVRERAIHPQRFKRAVTTIETLEKGMKAKNKLYDLYPKLALSKLRVNPLTSE